MRIQALQALAATPGSPGFVAAMEEMPEFDPFELDERPCRLTLVEQDRAYQRAVRRAHPERRAQMLKNAKFFALRHALGYTNFSR